MHRARVVVTAVVVGCALGVVACGGTDWVKVIDADATSATATEVMLTLGICALPASIPPPIVTESSTEIRVRETMRHPDGPGASCASGQRVVLGSPIGQRVVVDDRTGRQFAVRVP
jgi:hypothetical protein